MPNARMTTTAIGKRPMNLHKSYVIDRSKVLTPTNQHGKQLSTVNTHLAKPAHYQRRLLKRIAAK